LIIRGVCGCFAIRLPSSVLTFTGMARHSGFGSVSA